MYSSLHLFLTILLWVMMSSIFRDKTRVHGQGFTVNNWGTAGIHTQVISSRSCSADIPSPLIASVHKQSLCSCYSDFWDTVSVYCSHDLRTSFRGNAVRQEKTWMWLKGMCGNFWLLCSIFPLFDCLYWIQHWVFFHGYLPVGHLVMWTVYREVWT